MGECDGLWIVWVGIGIALIVAIRWYLDRCPECGCRSWKQEIKAERIPGSEHKVTTMTDPNQGPRTEIRAQFRVWYGCRHCELEFWETETRTISSTDSGPYYDSGSGLGGRQGAPTPGAKSGERIGWKH
jgi:hypothetical protein